jgi:putative MATE family efflux protein
MASIKDKITPHFSSPETPFPFVVGLLLPVVVDQFFMVGFNVLNTAMISSSGKEAISAVNMVGSLNYFLMQIFVAVGLGGTVLIAQTLGDKKFKEVGRQVLSTLVGAVGVAVMITVVGLIFRKQILSLLFGQADPLVLQNANVYFASLLAIYPIQAIVDGTTGSLRGFGKTKESLKITLVMYSVFIAMNVLFLNQLHMGVPGLTYSLVISRLVGALMAVLMLRANAIDLRVNFKDVLTLKLAEIKRIIKIAIPFATESMAFNGGKILVQMIVVSFGTDMMTAFAIATNWTLLSEVVPTALGTSLVPIVGRNIGAGRLDDAKRLAKSFTRAGIVAFIVIDGLLLLGFPLGMKLFSPEPKIYQSIFQVYVIFVITHIIAWSHSFVLPQALRAGGDGKFTTLISMLSMWIYRVGGSFLVGYVLGFGIRGIALVMGTEWMIRGLIFRYRFHSGKWVHRL